MCFRKSSSLADVKKNNKAETIKASLDRHLAQMESPPEEA